MFKNAYEDDRFAEAYSRLEFPGTYYLAYRDLPRLLRKHACGQWALDFGCGAGRSTRFLDSLGFTATGIDISQEMVKLARSIDPKGDYRVVPNGRYNDFADSGFDLILSAFTFDNIPTFEKKEEIFTELNRLLKPRGVMINLVSSPDIYMHEWCSFSTKDFPGNQKARCGDSVLIINTSIADSRPVEDIIWPDKDYRKIYESTGFEVIEMHKPLGRPDEGITWVNEDRIAPWSIYVLRKRPPKRRPLTDRSVFFQII